MRRWPKEVPNIVQRGADLITSNFFVTFVKELTTIRELWDHCGAKFVVVLVPIVVLVSGLGCGWVNGLACLLGSKKGCVIQGACPRAAVIGSGIIIWLTIRGCRTEGWHRREIPVFHQGRLQWGLLFYFSHFLVVLALCMSNECNLTSANIVWCILEDTSFLINNDDSVIPHPQLKHNK